MRYGHILFVKYPEEGKVKTRLGRDIGNEKAVSIYRQLVEGTIFASAVPEIDLLLFVEPYSRLTEFKGWLGDDLRYFPQADLALGERMHDALKTAFAEGYDRCVLTGSDIPDLNADVIYSALDKLAEHDAVIGPAEDGGYYLIGFQKDMLTDTVFQGIEWSTDKVYQQTAELFASAGLSLSVTETLADLDTVKDLKNMKKTLEDRGIHW